jgi:hypothetical protein
MTEIVLVLDTEWLLSTLFDASLLSTSKAAGNGGSFFAGLFALGWRDQMSRKSTVTKRVLFDAWVGNHILPCCWTLARRRAMIYSS